MGKDTERWRQIETIKKEKRRKQVEEEKHKRNDERKLNTREAKHNKKKR